MQFSSRSSDPDQLNRQGQDVGTQYRSEIGFYQPGRRKSPRRTSTSREGKVSTSRRTKLSASRCLTVAEDTSTRITLKLPQRALHKIPRAPKVEALKRIRIHLKEELYRMEMTEADRDLLRPAIVALGCSRGSAVVLICARSGADRYVTVKGISEREVQADLVIWPLRLVSASDDLATANSQLQESLRKIREFLSAQQVDPTQAQLQDFSVMDAQTNQYSGGVAAGARFVPADWSSAPRN